MGCLGSRQGKVSGLVEPEAGGAERSYEYRKKFGGTLLSAAPLGLMCQRLLLPPGHTDRGPTTPPTPLAGLILSNPTSSIHLPHLFQGHLTAPPTNPTHQPHPLTPPISPTHQPDLIQPHPISPTHKPDLIQPHPISPTHKPHPTQPHPISPTHQPLPNQPQPTTPTPSTLRPPALLGRSKEPEEKATENKTDSLSKIFSDESSSALGFP